MKKIICLLMLSIIGIFLFVSSATARDASTISDWYIKDFQAEITVNKDSSLDITETITADCGTLPDKHGIFRVLPTGYQKTKDTWVDMPIKLQSITNTAGVAYSYSTNKDYLNDTLTWQIGDADKTVTGVNVYVIKYQVRETARLDNAEFDEFYWNVGGYFWDIPTDNFKATVHFPAEITKDNSKLNIYSGAFGTKDSTLVTSSWTDINTLQIVSTRMLSTKEGITASVTFPKGIITYTPTFFEKYGSYFIFPIPFLVLLLCLLLWSKYGRDPKLNKPEMAQYEAPKGLTPMEMGTLYNNGTFKNEFLSAAIVDLAVSKIIKIDEVQKKGLFGKKDYTLTLIAKKKVDSLSIAEKTLVNGIFSSADTVSISSLKDKFYTTVDTIKNQVKASLIEKKLISKAGFAWQIGFIVLGLLLMFAGFFAMIISLLLGAMLFISGLIFIIFSFIMRRRTAEGAEILWQTQGFRLYMTKAEKYRQQFFEKEGMFEKFLPYAMVFGITAIWINNMKKIYGEEYFNTYRPYWYYGAFTTFNPDTFNKSMNELSSSMSQTLSSSPSSSGSGGGGGGW